MSSTLPLTNKANCYATFERYKCLFIKWQDDFTGIKSQDASIVDLFSFT